MSLQFLANRLPGGIDRIVAYFSHALTELEAKWKTIVAAKIHFRTHPWGHCILIETDHLNLTYIHAGNFAKLARWSMFHCHLHVLRVSDFD